MSVDALLTDVLAAPLDTEWCPGNGGIYARTYCGVYLEVFEQTSRGYPWLVWLNINDPALHEGHAPSVDLAKLHAERAAEGEDGGPATDALAAMEAS